MTCSSILVKILFLNVASSSLCSLRFCSRSFLVNVLILRFSNISFIFSLEDFFSGFFSPCCSITVLCISCCHLKIICYCFVWDYINCEICINCRNFFIVTDAILVMIICCSFYTFKAWWYSFGSWRSWIKVNCNKSTPTALSTSIQLLPKFWSKIFDFCSYLLPSKQLSRVTKFIFVRLLR